MKNTKIQIVGAGFSGLSLAWELQKKGFTVEIFEQSKQVGGLIQTIRCETHLRETAANGVLYNERFARLAKELDVVFIPTRPQAKKRFIFRDGQMRRWPLSFLASLGLFFRGLLFFIQYKWTKSFGEKSTESLYDWAQRKLGPDFTRYVLSAGIRGIFAISPKKLNASAVLNSFKAVIANTQNEVRGTWAPQFGMGQLIQSLYEKLKLKNIIFREQKIRSLEDLPIDDKNIVVLATSAWDAAQILKLESLNKISAIPLLSVTCVWPETVMVPEAFGCLVNEEDSFFAKGVLFNRSLFENRGPNASETWIVGQDFKDSSRTDSVTKSESNPTHNLLEVSKNKARSICDLTDDEIKTKILSDRQRLTNVGGVEPVEFYVQRWPQAIPAYDNNLSEFLRDFKNENFLPKNIFLTGNYLGKIGLAKIYDNNILLAERLDQLYL